MFQIWAIGKEVTNKYCSFAMYHSQNLIHTYTHTHMCVCIFVGYLSYHCSYICFISALLLHTAHAFLVDNPHLQLNNFLLQSEYSQSQKVCCAQQSLTNYSLHKKMNSVFKSILIRQRELTFNIYTLMRVIDVPTEQIQLYMHVYKVRKIRMFSKCL